MRFDAIVIGAGFAGLSAATELARQGGRVLVLEAAPRLGGRATAFIDRVTGELVDNGQHVLFGCYRETFRFLRTIGADAGVSLQSDLQVPIVDAEGRCSLLRFPPLPAPLHLLAGVLDWEALPLMERVTALRMVGPLKRARAWADGRSAALPASPGETVATWLRLNGQAASLCTLLWEPLALAALNQPASDAAALPFARVLAGLFSGDRRDAAIGLPLQPLHRMYAEPARAYIEQHGGEVRTGARARITVDRDRVAGVDTQGETHTAAAVVAAVPWFALDGLFDSTPRALAGVCTAAAAMRASPIVTANLWLDRPVFDGPLLGLPGRTFQWAFDKRAVFGSDASHLSLVSSGAASVAEWSREHVIARALADLRGALPPARAARVRRATVVRERAATFSLAPGEPRRPETRTALGGLLLAGDWIETGLPGTIESAVVSGHRAAALAHGGVV